MVLVYHHVRKPPHLKDSDCNLVITLDMFWQTLCIHIITTVIFSEQSKIRWYGGLDAVRI